MAPDQDLVADEDAAEELPLRVEPAPDLLSVLVADEAEPEPKSDRLEPEAGAGFVQ